MQNQTVLITGATAGIGEACARRFAQLGARLILTGRREARLNALRAELGEGRVHCLAFDMTDKAQLSRAVESLPPDFQEVTVLVNNAGTMVIGETILEIEPARWDQAVASNVRGPYLVCRAILPGMMEQRRGSIINIGSRMGNDPKLGGGVLYSSSKAALHMFSFCLADEVREYNIAVNILSPGALKSEGSAALPWAQHDWHERVDPEVVGPSAVYLGLQDARSFTGQLVSRAEFGKTWGL